MTHNPNTQTEPTQTDADRGRAIVTWHAERRAMHAERARDNRALPYRLADMMASASAGTRLAVRRIARDTACQHIAAAPARLATRADILRHADTLAAWATMRDETAPWDSWPCGYQDAEVDRINAAREDARYLRAYAGTLT